MPTTRYLSYRRRRRRRRRNFWLIVLLVLLLAAAGVLTWIAFSNLSGEPQSSSQLEESSVVSDLAAESSLPTDELSNSKSQDPADEEISSGASELWESLPEEGSSSSADTGVWTTFNLPLPEGAEVTDDYFSDAVFIGDSRTQGFILYSGLSNTTAYADKGLSVESVFTKEVISTGNAKVSVMDALAQKPDFKKVYLMLGVNELGWAYSNIFQEKYQQVVQRIKEINPDAEIYAQSILPVSQAKSDGDKIYNNPKIQEYNQLIQEVAAEEEVYYLNVAEAVADESGVLPEEASTDGVHLNKEYCQKWLAYLKNHTAEGIGAVEPIE